MPQALADSLIRLRTFSQQPRSAHLQCELCAKPLAPEHEHVVETDTGRVSCCCIACALLFRDQSTARYRTVPRDASTLPDFRMTDMQWESLAIPIGLAFLFHSTRAGRVVAVYPSPAGGTESAPMSDAWNALEEQNPVLRNFHPDVEALLVYRIDGAREHFRVPIDECYKLVGLVRSKWRGFTGGLELWDEMSRFFDSLKSRCQR